MCGIFAVTWLETPPNCLIVDKAIEMLCQRGKDAWGMAMGADSVLSTSSSVIHKEASRIDLKKNKKKIFSVLRKAESPGWFLLHARLATNGYSGLDKHNHPIVCNHIELIHNGLVIEWPTEVKFLINDSNTDSQNLASVIAGASPSELEKVLNQTLGEISAIWRDRLENTLKMYTNVGGLYLESTSSYTAVSSEPIQEHSISYKVELRKIVTL